MAPSELEIVVGALKGIEFEAGLTPDELKGVEQRYEFSFPPVYANFYLLRFRCRKIFQIGEPE